MSDDGIRKLERRVLLGDETALERLKQEWLRHKCPGDFLRAEAAEIGRLRRWLESMVPWRHDCLGMEYCGCYMCKADAALDGDPAPPADPGWPKERTEKPPVDAAYRLLGGQDPAP